MKTENKILIQMTTGEVPSENEVENTLSGFESALIDNFGGESDPVEEGGYYIDNENQECTIWFMLNLDVGLSEIDEQLMSISEEYDDMLCAFDFTNRLSQKYIHGEYDTGSFSDSDSADNYLKLVDCIEKLYKQPPESLEGNFPAV